MVVGIANIRLGRMLQLARFLRPPNQHPDQIISGRSRPYLVNRPPLLLLRCCRQPRLSESCVKPRHSEDDHTLCNELRALPENKSSSRIVLASPAEEQTLSLPCRNSMLLLMHFDLGQPTFCGQAEETRRLIIQFAPPLPSPSMLSFLPAFPIDLPIQQIGP